MEKASDFVKELIQFTNEGVAVFDGMMHKARVIGYLKSIEKKVQELERLADIGRATEKVMIDGMIFTNPVYNGSGICEGQGETLSNVEELLEWEKGE